MSYRTDPCRARRDSRGVGPGVYEQLRAEWQINRNWTAAVEGVQYQVGDVIRRAGGLNANYCERGAQIRVVTMSASRATLPLLLSLNAGYVDTAGFLALQGLFTAHVTGNFVTLGASLALGTSGAIAKLLALPVFCAVVIAARLCNTGLSNRHRRASATLVGGSTF